MSLAGIPAVSIPAGLAEPDDGGPELPVGLQVCAPAFGESGMLDAAYAIENAIGFEQPAANPAAPGREAEEAAGQ
jgi:aspartyl-tRNA(Asn)/glutamyl-tRNA(Gln) amidotransferase subunit A